MNTLLEVKKHLSPGHLYRRCDLEKWSNAVDRHLHQLQEEHFLLKLSPGLYYYPKQTSFGLAPPADHDLVESFLKDNRFLLMTSNAYNSLGVGTTQLYNETVVYNHKRHGYFKLGNRTFRFIMKPYFPLEISYEFLLVDLVNNMNKIAENKESVLNLVKEKAKFMNQELLSDAVQYYAGARAKKFFAMVLRDESLVYGA